MAGATNRAMKAAGVPKATIATLRVEQGGHLSLKSAISIAHERGLDTGKAHEFMAKRDAKKAGAPASQAATADFRSKAAATMKAAGERKAAMMAERQKRIAGTVRDLGRGMLAARKAGAKPSFDGAMGKFKAHAQKQIDDYYKANFPNSKTKPTLHYSDGEKYIRVTKVEPGQKTGSAHSFIDKATGDVLKPDGFKRPAKGARGNIFTGDFGVNEHGANYSAAYMKRRGATDFYAAPSKGPSKREKQANADARDVVMGPRAGAKKPAGEPQRWKNAVDERPQSVDVGYSSRRSVANAGGFHAVAYPQPGGRVNFDVVHPRTGARIASVATADDAKKILRAVASGRLEKQLKDGALPSPRTRVALQRVVDAVQRSALKRAIEIGKQKRQWTGRQERELSALEANRISGRKR